MTYTSYIYYTTGQNLYAKAEPMDTGTWSAGVVAYTENGSTGSYAATLDETLAYAVYKRAGGSPASTDTKIGYEPVNLAVSVKAKTDLIGTGATIVNAPVAETGNIAQIIIGDDYLAANGRAFQWTIAEPSGFVASTATVTFGLTDKNGTNVQATGTATDNGSTWLLSVDLDKTKTGLLVCGVIKWSVEVKSAGGTEITVIMQDDNEEPTQAVEKRT